MPQRGKKMTEARLSSLLKGQLCTRRLAWPRTGIRASWSTLWGWTVSGKECDHRAGTFWKARVKGFLLRPLPRRDFERHVKSLL